jgi:LacI family transcriptional regulator
MPGDAATASVSFDSYKGAELAMQHLASLGHRRIALVCGRSDVNDRARERRRAYEDFMHAAGLPVEAAMIHEGDFQLDRGRDAMRELLRLPLPPTGLFCANDIQAVGALHACGEYGLRVPEDISIVGFDDLPAAQYVRPQLTTIRVPAHEMGQLAATNVLQALVTGQRPLSAELPIELVVRHSAATVQSDVPRRRSRGRAKRRG